jgi:hypothetical protein
MDASLAELSVVGLPGLRRGGERVGAPIDGVVGDRLQEDGGLGCCRASLQNRDSCQGPPHSRYGPNLSERFLTRGKDWRPKTAND